MKKGVITNDTPIPKILRSKLKIVISSSKIGVFTMNYVATHVISETNEVRLGELLVLKDEGKELGSFIGNIIVNVDSAIALFDQIMFKSK